MTCSRTPRVRRRTAKLPGPAIQTQEPDQRQLSRSDAQGQGVAEAELDLDEGDEKWITALWQRGANQLRRRDLGAVLSRSVRSNPTTWMLLKAGAP